MDLAQFASEPSDPRWEQPAWREPNAYAVVEHDAEDGNSDVSQTNAPDSESRSERKAALHGAASELDKLCARDPPVADVQGFMAKCEDSVGRLQANVLAWFSDTNAIESACKHNNQDVLRFLLIKGLRPTAKAARSAGVKGRQTKDYGCLRLLVDFGLDIHEPIEDGVPPVMSLALDDREFVGWLLSKGADPNASSLEGQTVMHLAARYGTLDVLQLLTEHGDLVQGQNLVAHACLGNNELQCLETVRFLLDHGAAIDAYYGQNYNSLYEETWWPGSIGQMVWGRQNALHLAISSGNTDLVRLLIERGADKSLPGWSAMKPMNGQSLSPVDIARKCGHEEIVGLLESP